MGYNGPWLLCVKITPVIDTRNIAMISPNDLSPMTVPRLARSDINPRHHHISAQTGIVFFSSKFSSLSDVSAIQSSLVALVRYAGSERATALLRCRTAICFSSPVLSGKRSEQTANKAMGRPDI